VMAQSVDPTQPREACRFIGTSIPLEWWGLGSRTPSGPAVHPDCVNRPDTWLQATSVRHATFSLARRGPSTHESPTGAGVDPGEWKWR